MSFYWSDERRLYERWRDALHEAGGDHVPAWPYLSAPEQAAWAALAAYHERALESARSDY